ncbi:MULTISPECIES: tRNA (adenine-N1)-methyltransferase [Methanosphaera]|uniref:SAM-dependent methyltransferase n=1 Tax=Methanosphaera stadtmanae TaxID=2317 RepID=A0A328Q402_9EURY|nr:MULTISPECIES: tRNA (adenine-N1)-methyltransferase [Methanosphaera]MDO5821606.1 tRNA (adenine-N1)-methyltransferase [Methanosphaera sp.]MEE0489804.1 tRNA (adenine-N1)-methyltransferase [Methanosphaera stadtmanae]RAP03864.1 SAM-dependent methyltransferase [Methanosphaera stadtmanae]RAP48912.1 MAG: SAM-dependent methyltransferase [Methanosphaera sp. DEW79]
MKIIVDKKNRKYVIHDTEFHTEKGVISQEDIINAKVGDVLETHMGKKYTVIEPNINDYIDLMKRNCSILLPQDLGLITGFTGIGYGSKIVESGTGAGSSLLFFANIVGPDGHVSSYEIREDFVKIIKENISGTDFKNITLYNQDVTEGFKEEDNSIDLVFLDLPKPGEVIEDAYRILKTGGFIAVYTPYVEQFQIVNKVLGKSGFKNIKIREGNVRELEIKKNKTRPNSRMAGHTGYITFARKL